MNGFVADTMAVVLWLEKRKMPQKAKEIFKGVENKEIQLYVPGMVLIEIGYLSENNRIDITLSKALSYFNSINNISCHNIDAELIKKTFEITDIPELHDRIIAASGALFNLAVITNDPKIIASKFVDTIWN